MGRKCLKTQKVSDILDAFETCIQQRGLQGTTLDDIAREAKMARRMVRHYVGNRSELIKQGVARIIAKFSLSAFTIIERENSESRLEAGLDYLFSEQFNALEANRSVAALLPVSYYDEQVKTALKAVYNQLQQYIFEEIVLAKPTVDVTQCQDVAYNVMCLAFGSGWMLNLGFDSSHNAKNKQLAQQLINAL